MSNYQRILLDELPVRTIDIEGVPTEDVIRQLFARVQRCPTLAFHPLPCHFSVMSNKELVADLVQRLPDDVSLLDIAHEIELLAGIKTAREQAGRGEGIPAEDAKKLVAAWASK